MKTLRPASLVFTVFLFFAFLGFCAEPFSVPAFASASRKFVPGEVVVAISKTGSVHRYGAKTATNSIAASVGASVKTGFGAVSAISGKEIVVMRSDVLSTEELVERLKRHEDVVGVEPNMIFTIPENRSENRSEYFGATRSLRTRIHEIAAPGDVVPDDPYYESGHMWGLDQMNMPGAWGETTGTAEVFVAVVDTGIDNSHPDLVQNIGTDLDGGWGINTYTEGTPPLDDHGHGTHVAGIIGAIGDNALGTPGVNWNVSILAVKTLGGENAEGSSENIIAGIEYLLDQKERGLNIVAANFSLGAWWGLEEDEATSPYAIAFKALSDAGVFIVCASGNEAQDLDNPGGAGTNPKDPDESYTGKKHWPSTMTLPTNKISVAAIDEDGNLASFSNWSPTGVDIAAPGVGIWSTVPGNDYEAWDGTSMAAPHVAGLVALLKAKTPDMTLAMIKELLTTKIIEKNALEGKTASAGIPDAGAALRTGTDPVTGVELDKENLEVAIGGSGQLTATLQPRTARDTELTWTSSDTSIATVSESGLVTGVAEGSAVVTVATEEGGFTATCDIAVSGEAEPDPEPTPEPGDPWAGKEGCSATGVTFRNALLLVPFVFLAGKTK